MSAVQMDKEGNPQKRTTYLISLTLVKVEALPEDGDGAEDVAGNQKEALPEGEGSPGKEVEETQDVSCVPDKEGGVVRAEEVEKELSQVCKEEEPAEEEVEVLQVRHGTPTESRGKPYKWDTHIPHKDFSGKSKDTPLVHAPVRQMVKVYGGTLSEGPVRREGHRSEALRPKTELYREPPVLFLKGENGADLSNRSRSSLPFSIPPQVSPRPEVVMRSHTGGTSVGWREPRDVNTNLYHCAKTMERRDNWEHSTSATATTLGPYRASWADSDGRGTLIRPGAPSSGGYSGIMARESPQGERYKAVSVSLPTPPVTDVFRPQRKGVSCTLDNSDLHSFSDDFKKGKEGSQGGTVQRAPPRDRKMLKFISGIFTKSTPVPPTVNTPPPLYPAVERGSSEEEGEFTSFTATVPKNYTKI